VKEVPIEKNQEVDFSPGGGEERFKGKSELDEESFMEQTRLKTRIGGIQNLLTLRGGRPSEGGKGWGKMTRPLRHRTPFLRQFGKKKKKWVTSTVRRGGKGTR